MYLRQLSNEMSPNSRLSKLTCFPIRIKNELVFHTDLIEYQDPSSIKRVPSSSRRFDSSMLLILFLLLVLAMIMLA